MRDNFNEITGNVVRTKKPIGIYRLFTDNVSGIIRKVESRIFSNVRNGDIKKFLDLLSFLKTEKNVLVSE